MAKLDTQKLAELALGQVDQAGFILDRLGVRNNINRHSLIALAFDQQKRFEGQRDSLESYVESNVSKVRSRILSIKEAGEDRQRQLIEKVDSTVAYVRERISA